MLHRIKKENDINEGKWIGVGGHAENGESPEECLLREVKEETLGIPAQESVRSGGSTDGAPIHLSNDGVPTIVIGLPVRYIHSHWGIASLSDFTHAVDLAEAVIRRLDAATIAAFRGGALA